jgi:BirA family biotin operon repressor/biotin-[acetyl-CoA-carboxylase] ligase
MMLPAPFVWQQRGRIDSTNDEARRLAESGHGHGTVVSATEQTAGRGRRGRPWSSPPGNLFCSLLLDPGAAPGAAPQLTFVAAVALRDALAELAPAGDFRVKWPNDILCNGAKIAGMLLEQAGTLVILGVGANIVWHPDTALYPATCLKRIGSGASAADVVIGFCAQLARRYDQWRQQGFAAIRADWLAGAKGIGEPVTARLADGSELTGIFRDLDADGALQLQLADGRLHRVVAGDVFFDGNDRHHAAGD